MRRTRKTADTRQGEKGRTVQDLGALPGHRESEALGINSSGDIVGSSGDFDGLRRAVLWRKNGGIQDLGTLTGGASSRAHAISSRDEVVGTSHTHDGNRAFIWTKKDGMQDLNKLLISRSGLVRSAFVLTLAVAINNSGTILATGEDDLTADAAEHAHGHQELPIQVFLLTPRP
jgi:probable HAF family extracellular repeat protein